MKHILEKLTPIGTVIAAAGCPTCFPALAAVGSALGLGVLAGYDKQFLIIMQIFMVLTMIFFYVSYRRTKYIYSFLTGLLSGALMFFSWYVVYNPFVFYSGMIGIIATSFWNFWLERKIPSCKDGVCSTNNK